jgi:nucleotide-binding universal stress UspA family protein
MRILLAVDLKSKPELLVDAAAAWGERLSAPIDLVYVDEMGTPIPKVKDPAVQAKLEAGWHAQRAVHEGDLAALLQRLPEAVRGRAILEAGAVIPAVVRVAVDYDLVILGNDARAGFAAILGSASEGLVRAFKKPVMLLRVG